VKTLLRISSANGGMLLLPVLIVSLAIVFSILSPVFFSISNLQQLLNDSSVLIILAVGEAMVIIARGFDLSIEGNMSLVSVATANIALHIGSAAGIGAGLIMGLVIGCVNGFLVARLAMSPLIVTLAAESILGSLAFIWTNGLPVFGLPDNFGWAATATVGPLPVPALLAILVFILAVTLSRSTPFGIHMYATGNNPSAARLSGLNPSRILFVTYAISGVLAAVAAVILTSRVDSGQPALAPGLSIQVLAAVFLGGVSLAGGRGSFFQVLWAVLLLEMLTNGLTLVGVQSYLQSVAAGAVLIAAITIQLFVSGGADQVRGAAFARLLNLTIRPPEAAEVTDSVSSG
jgi:ribose transport system permease protein